ncbi:MAG: hypothetical protein ACJ76H_08220 [Bacteriovoracaceae bacterium]
MKTSHMFLVCLAFFFLTFLSARAEDVTIVARVHDLKDGSPTLHHAIALENEGLAIILSGLAPDDEVLLKGHVEYHPVKIENRTLMNPTFHVEKAVPISLKKLGLGEIVTMERPVTFIVKPQEGPRGLPMSGEVANSLTLTTTFLMLKDLAGNQATQPKTDTLNSGLIFGAGVLATGLFLWEQIHPTKKGRNL